MQFISQLSQNQFNFSLCRYWVSDALSKLQEEEKLPHLTL